MIWTPRKRLWKPADRRGLMAFSLAGCCCEEEFLCDQACLNNNYPDQLQVDIADVADTDPVNAACNQPEEGSCTNVNGTYVVDFVGLSEFISGSIRRCIARWEGDISDLEACNGTYETLGVTVTRQISPTAQRTITVAINGTGGISGTTWSTSAAGTPYDCTAFSGLSIGLFLGDSKCDFSSSTASVTAL